MIPGLAPSFEDLDQKSVFDKVEKTVKETASFNLAVLFGQDISRAAVELNVTELQTFLEINAQEQATVKWIHISGPDRQTDFIDQVAERYKISSRLKAIIKSPNNLADAGATPTSRVADGAPQGDSSGKSNGDMKDAPTHTSDLDLEKAPHTGGPSNTTLDKLNHYSIASRVWHFWSIDWTERCLCVGYNSLSSLVVEKPQDNADRDRSRRKKFRSKFDPSADEQASLPKPEPNAIRLWNWLLICDDNTIISIQESGVSAGRQAISRGRPKMDHGEVIENSRKTLLNVLRHLSLEGIKNAGTMDALDIRPGCSRDTRSAVNISDSLGLLFYYLFDDWYTTFTLVADDDCRYTTVLTQLRGEMLHKAEVSRIDQLHQAGQQLHVLKRLYGSYNLIIDRILSRTKVQYGIPKAEHGSQPGQIQRTETSISRPKFSDDGGQSFQVPLSPKASVRFERLRDRITMFALSEIEQCMEERDSLVSFNFNLIAMRQSQAVEKLTRITILLAKVTILFMPVSVLTGYFSTQIDDLQHVYTAETYWISFAVTLFISVLFLIIFGFISKTLEGGIIYRTTIQATMQPIRKLLMRGNRKHHMAKSDG